MPIEAELCKRLADILKDLFTESGIEIETDGNWLIDAGGFKDVDETGAGSKLYVTVLPRSYPEYTAKTAEMDVRIEANFRHDDAPDGAKAVACYGKLIGLLGLWHDDFAAMKTALRLDNFDPCGLRLSGGQWNRETDPLGWSLDQSFTIKGRIKRK